MDNKPTESLLLQNLILATLAYYDVLSLPLTLTQLCCYILVYPEARDGLNIISHNFGEYISPSKIEANLEILMASERVEERRGFYFLKGRHNIVAEKIWKDKISQEKLWQVKKNLYFVRWLPFIRLIMISGSLCLRNAHKDSDYDLLIAVKQGRIWTTRAMLIIFLALLGLRRSKENIKDKFCLNHFITDENLVIPFQSIYNAVNYEHLLTVIEDGLSYGDFLAKNSWMNDYVLSARGQSENPFLIKKKRSIAKSVLEKILSGFIGNHLENFFRRYQKKRINRNIAPEGKGRITVSEKMLEFHPASPEARIIEEFNIRLKNLRIEFPEAKDSGLS